jgi:hypothetical protein
MHKLVFHLLLPFAEAVLVSKCDPASKSPRVVKKDWCFVHDPELEVV